MREGRGREGDREGGGYHWKMYCCPRCASAHALVRGVVARGFVISVCILRAEAHDVYSSGGRFVESWQGLTVLQAA